MTSIRSGSLIRPATMLVLVALYCLAPISAALAQVVSLGSYYEESKNVQCTSGSSSVCQLVFGAAPQNILVTDVSCAVQASQPIGQAGLGVSDTATSTGALRRTQFFPLHLLSTNFYATVFKTNFLFGSGKWPSIYFNMVTLGTGVLNCKIVGTLQ